MMIRKFIRAAFLAERARMSQAQVTASFCEIAISELADGVAIADLIPVDSRVEVEHVSMQPGDQIDEEGPALLLASSSLGVI